MRRSAVELRMRRRSVIAGIAALPFASAARAATDFDATTLGVTPNTLDDQSAAMQAALDAAHEGGASLVLPAGQIFAHDLALPAGIRIIGQPGRTILISNGVAPVGRAYLANDLAIEGVTFSAGAAASGGGDGGLLEIEGSLSVRLTDCTFLAGPANGLVVSNSGVTASDCDFEDFGDTAIFSRNGRGLSVLSCRIAKCGNAGIRVWRDVAGDDGARIIGNAISDIRWDGGGNGQNGNGVNVFRADNVTVADNHIEGCAFTAVRLNATKNAMVRGNTCLGSGEVAIFSEFGFSGSVIADNIIDDAAFGISITNLDSGGRLAVCSGNIVRNITAKSEVNPDTRPVGIYAEADTTITGNAVDAVPGVGIVAGYGPFLRNVVIADNIVSGSKIGIGASVVEKAGAVTIANNIVWGASDKGIVGLRWDEVASDDLARDAGQYPHVSISGNRVELDRP